jgi:hypothetical protein
VAETFSYFQAHTYLGSDSREQIARKQDGRRAREQVLGVGSSKHARSCRRRVTPDPPIKHLSTRTMVYIAKYRLPRSETLRYREANPSILQRRGTEFEIIEMEWICRAASSNE